MFNYGDFVIGNYENDYTITCTHSICVVVDRSKTVNGRPRYTHDSRRSTFVVRIDKLENGEILTKDRNLQAHGRDTFGVDDYKFRKASRELVTFYLRHKYDELVRLLGNETMIDVCSHEENYIRDALFGIPPYENDICVAVNETGDYQPLHSTSRARTFNPYPDADDAIDAAFFDRNPTPRFATAERRKAVCEFCGKEFYENDLYEVTDDNEDYVHMLCSDCKHKSRRLRHWSRLTPKFSNPDKRRYDLHIGFELEVDDGNDYLRTIYDIKSIMGDGVYCERDGSLHRSGIEIISMPMNYNDYISAPLKDMFKACLNNGYKSHNTTTCGLHFHCDRRFLNEQDIRRLEWFISKYYDTVIFNVSRRSSLMNMEQWANVSKSLKKDTEIHSVCKRLTTIDEGYDWGKYDNDHHFAFNKENSNTVEFRFFRGTLNYDTFMMSYKFVYELCLIAKMLSDEDAFTLTNWTNKMSADVRKFIETKGRRVIFDKDFPVCHIKNKKYNKVTEEEGEL